MKASELRKLSTEDINQKLKEQKDSLHKMTFNHSIAPIENTSLIKTTKKSIARILTELNSRQQ